MRPTFDSRRWTGNYRPGEEPPEFAVPYRRRSSRWKLGAIMLLAAVLAVAQTLAPDDRSFPFLVAGVFIWPSAHLSPYARRPFGGAHAGRAAEENAIIARATALAYRWLTGLVVAACVYLALAARHGWPAPHRTADWLAWGIVFAIIATHLPAFLAELRTPLPADPKRN